MLSIPIAMDHLYVSDTMLFKKYTYHCMQESRLTIVSHEAKKQAVHDE